MVYKLSKYSSPMEPLGMMFTSPMGFGLEPSFHQLLQCFLPSLGTISTNQSMWWRGKHWKPMSGDIFFPKPISKRKEKFSFPAIGRELKSELERCNSSFHSFSIQVSLDFSHALMRALYVITSATRLWDQCGSLPSTWWRIWYCWWKKVDR